MKTKKKNIFVWVRGLIVRGWLRHLSETLSFNIIFQGDLIVCTVLAVYLYTVIFPSIWIGKAFLYN